MGDMAKTPAITRALAGLRRPRPCRVCGTVFRPERFDTLVCSDTCRWRKTHGGGADLAYIETLQTEVAVYEARRFHEHIESLIKEVRAHTAAERERRYKRRGYLANGQMFAAAETLALAHFRTNPNIDRDELTDAVMEELDYPPVFVASKVNHIMEVRRVVLERLHQSPATRDQLIEAVRDAIWYCDDALAAVIVDSVLALPSTATIIADPDVFTIAAPVAPGGDTPKAGAASTATTGPAVPSRPLLPEATAILEKLYQTWRLAVIKVLDDLPPADRRVEDKASATALNKVLPHIPPEAIRQILKEL
jgi:hypothetical protein